MPAVSPRPLAPRSIRPPARLLALTGALALALAAPTLAAGPAVARASDTACHPRGAANPAESGSDAVQDIDGDDANDVVVGVPRQWHNTPDNFGNGAVEALLSSAGDQQLIDGVFGESQTTISDRWGSAVAISDLDHDLCADLVVGGPGDAFTHGHVTILFGSPTGVQATPYRLLTAPTPANGDGYGAAVAVDREPGDGASVIWVGAPGTTVNGVAGAGAVYQYLVAADGTVTAGRTVTEASPALGLTPVAGDHFGAVLAPEYGGSVLVGAPDRTVAGQAGAGLAAFLSTDFAGGPLAAEAVTQDSPGVPGKAEAGDHFGAALDGLTVGVPGEDIGSIKNAGSVQVFTLGSGAALLVPGKAYDEDSKGVPGKAEKGDRFGAAVAVAGGFACQEANTTAVGVPGESIGAITGAGAVVGLPSHGDEGACPGFLLAQGSGLPGKAEAGDHVGAALTRVPDVEGQDEDTHDTVLVGVPGEDIGTVRDAGIVQWVFGRGRVRDFTSVNGATTGLGFGAVLGHAPAGTVN